MKFSTFKLSLILGFILSVDIAYADMARDLSREMAGQPLPDCSDGRLYSNGTGAGLRYMTLEAGRVYEYCFFLPRNRAAATKNPLVEVSTVNLGNASCSDVEMILIRPNRKTIYGDNVEIPREYYSRGPQPGAVSAYTPGKWRLMMRLNEGCDRYTLNVRFAK